MICYNSMGDSMKRKFFNVKENKSCSCCVFGEKSPFNQDVFCRKHGVCDKRDCCRHFKYDVLKRNPTQKAPSDNYSPEDFNLDI